MRRVSPLLFHQTAKVCILQPHLRTRRCVEFRISSHPALRFPRSCEYPQTFGCNRRMRNFSGHEKIDSSLQVATWTQLFLLLFALVSSSPLWSSLSNWNSWSSLWIWNGSCWPNEEDCSIRHVWNYPWSKCLRVDVWCQCIEFFNFRIKLNSVKQPIQSNYLGSSQSRLHYPQRHTT